MMLCFTLGWAVFWLLAVRLARLHAVTLFLSAVAILEGTAVLVAWDHGLQGDDLIVLCIFYCGIGVSVVSLGMPLAGFCHRGEGPSERFMWWLFVWFIVLPMVLSLFLMLPYVFEKGFSLIPSLVGGIFGMLLYMVNLPFMALTLKSPTYRKRFKAVMRFSLPQASQSLQGIRTEDASRGMMAPDNSSHEEPLEEHRD